MTSMNIEKQVITRFAPSPTGDPHIGNIRSALYAWLFARQNGGKFLLRIEDTDRNRRQENSEKYIIDSLTWLGLNWDGEAVFQSERRAQHEEAAMELVRTGHAYRCFCSGERLEQMRKEQQERKEPPRYDRTCRDLTQETIVENLKNNQPFVIRFKIPDGGETSVNELIRGKLVFKNDELDDFVILKSDKFPTYHLAHVVDDRHSEVTHVIRGDDWIPSLPKHVLLHQAFEWELPIYAHLPMVLATDKAKLGKRHGAVGVLEFKELGYLPDAMVNFLLLLGWHPKKGSEKEIFTQEEMFAEFKLEDIQKSGAVFDYQKLDWINAQYIKSLKAEQLAQYAKPFVQKLIDNNKTGVKLEDAVTLEQGRITKLSELSERLAFAFDPVDYDGELLIWKKSDRETAVKRLTLTHAILAEISEDDWNIEALESRIKSEIEAKDLGMGDTLWPLRTALAGQKDSPGPFEIAAVLGKKETLNRITTGLNKLQ